MAEHPKQGITQRLLLRAHNPKDAQRIFTDKIEYRKLYLRPNSPDPDNVRTARRKAKQTQERAQRRKAFKPKPLSSKERRRLGIYDLPKESKKYTIYEPLHAMWLGYIREALGSDLYHGGLAAAGKLTSAEFVGARVLVSRSSCPSRVGLRGIVIKDSKFVFEIVTEKNAVKTIPKQGTLFRVEVPPPHEHTSGSDDGKEAVPVEPFVFEIHGEQFQHRPADRSNKKFKNHFFKKL